MVSHKLSQKSQAISQLNSFTFWKADRINIFISGITDLSLKTNSLKIMNCYDNQLTCLVKMILSLKTRFH